MITKNFIKRLVFFVIYFILIGIGISFSQSQFTYSKINCYEEINEDFKFKHSISENIEVNVYRDHIQMIFHGNKLVAYYNIVSYKIHENSLEFEVLGEIPPKEFSFIFVDNGDLLVIFINDKKRLALNHYTNSD